MILFSPESFYNGPVWHVSNFGSNNNSGDDQNPFETIQYAYNRASENDTILVHPGVFNGSVWLYEKNVTLISLFALNGDSSIIDSTVIDGQNEDCNVFALQEELIVPQEFQVLRFKMEWDVFMAKEVVFTLKILVQN